MLDATTGLLYVGNGQYYDPATGRFLTREVYPNSPNPYVPWNPIGAIVGPLGVIALVFGRRRKGSKAGTFLVLAVVVGSVGMTLAGCGGEQPAPHPLPQPTAVPSNNNAPANPNPNETPQPGPGTDAGKLPSSTPSPVVTLTLPECPTPTWTPTPTLGSGSKPQNLNTSQKGKNFIKFWEAGQLPPPQHPYEDIAGRCTIGYGHTFWNSHHPEGKGCSREVQEWYTAHPLPYTGPDGKESAESFLQSDIEKSELAIERNIITDLTQAQFDALVSY